MTLGYTFYNVIGKQTFCLSPDFYSVKTTTIVIKKISSIFCIKNYFKVLQSLAYSVQKTKAGTNAFADNTYMQTYLYKICYNYIS